jgi:diguanylate cyclase (GGDEF)-like protein
MTSQDDSGAWPDTGAGAAPTRSRPGPGDGRRSDTITVNRYLYRRVQQLEHMLLSATGLDGLLQALLVSLPRHFAIPAAELWLYDPDGLLGELIGDPRRFGRSLRLLRDVFDIQDLYDADPEVVSIEATDPRMFRLLESEAAVGAAVLMPLLESGRLVGSLHWGLEEAAQFGGEADLDLIEHLGSIISICLQNAISRERLARLSLLDPDTGLGNRRSFEVELAREIARARRSRAPCTLLLLEIDDFADLAGFHGRSGMDALVRKLAERVVADLRLTDRLARLADARLAALLPGVNEFVGEEIAERMRLDLAELPIDDGRGAAMQTTASIGLVSWDPQAYPAVDMRQLARQLETAAVQGCERASAAGGNRVAVSRLKTLIF